MMMMMMMMIGDEIQMHPQRHQTQSLDALEANVFVRCMYEYREFLSLLLPLLLSDLKTDSPTDYLSSTISSLTWGGFGGFSTFLIEAKDKDGRPRTTGGDTWVVAFADFEEGIYLVWERRAALRNRAKSTKTSFVC